jgi:hypothetical protein
MERYLYVDWDGVLHDSSVFYTPERGPYIDTPGRTLFEWVPILEHILAPHPDVKIILSTSWVARFGMEGTAAWLPASLRKRVVGTTADGVKDPWSCPRGQQVLRAAQHRGIQDGWWLAIDDDAYQWPREYLDRLVKTNGATGLSDAVVQQKLKFLLARFEP